LIRPQGNVNVEKTEVRPKRWEDRVINFSSFYVQREDRIISFPMASLRLAWASSARPLVGAWKT
jgi:hypothetical protein